MHKPPHNPLNRGARLSAGLALAGLLLTAFWISLFQSTLNSVLLARIDRLQKALSQGKTMQDLIAELLAEYLKRAEKKGGDR